MKSIVGSNFILLFLFSQPAKSTTYTTIENGNWTDSSVWMSGVIPAFSINDSIIIMDTVYFDDDIFLNFGAYMQIDSLGGALCGHHNVTVWPGAELFKYGALCLDTLFITGGFADFILPGPFLMKLTKISNGGYFHVYTYEQSCMCPWDTCFIPIRPVVPPEEPVIYNVYFLFPNPSEGIFNLQYTQPSETTFYFYNMLGQILFSRKLEGTEGRINFNEYELNTGIYFWEVVEVGEIHQKGKHLIVK